MLAKTHLSKDMGNDVEPTTRCIVGLSIGSIVFTASLQDPYGPYGSLWGAVQVQFGYFEGSHSLAGKMFVKASDLADKSPRCALRVPGLAMHPRISEEEGLLQRCRGERSKARRRVSG